MAKLFQLANNEATYGERAGWWMVVSDDGEREIAGPYESQDRAETALKTIRLNDAGPDLLAALKILMADDGVVNCGIGNAGPLSQRHFIKAARAAKDAIAKAEGAQ